MIAMQHGAAVRAIDATGMTIRLWTDNGSPDPRPFEAHHSAFQKKKENKKEQQQ